MTKVNQKVKDLEHNLDQKKATIDSYFHRYETTMNPSDSQLRIQNTNDTYLEKDPVYNSPHASEQLKEAIKTRTLNGFTQEEFENQYMKALYGFSDKEKSGIIEGTFQSQETEKPQNTELIIPEDDFDKLPTKIEKPLTIRAGHTENYLLKKAREYSLSKGELTDLVDLKERYQTKFPTMLSLIDEGHTIEEVQMFLKAREEATESISENNIKVRQSQGPSLKVLANLYSTFGTAGMDESDLAHMAYEIHNQIGRRFYDSSINLVLQHAEKNQYADLEQTLESLNGMPMNLADASFLGRYEASEMIENGERD